jgi:hypothetical protein
VGGDGEDRGPGRAEWCLGMLGTVARALQRFGRFVNDFFCFDPNVHWHVHPTLRASQEEKLWPDNQEQENIDGTLEIPHRDGKKHNRSRNCFVIV